MTPPNGEHLSKQEAKTFDVQNLKELKKTFEDFKNTNSDFDVKQIKNELISRLDNKEGLSKSELHLLKLLNKAENLDEVISVIDLVIKLTEGFFTRLKNNVNEKVHNAKEKATKKLKETVGKTKKILKEGKRKLYEVERRMKVKLKDTKKIVKEYTGIATKIVKTTEKIDKDRKELEIAKKQGDSKKVIEKQKEIEQNIKELQKNKKSSEELKKDVIKDKEEVEKLTKEKDKIKSVISKTDKKLDEVLIETSKHMTGENDYEIQKALIEVSKVKNEKNDVDNISKYIEKKEKETKENIEVSGNIEVFNKEEIMKSIKKNMEKNQSDLLASNSSFNILSVNFFKNNPENIKNITDENKLIEVINNININCKLTFDQLVNTNFKNNYKILKLVYNNSYKPNHKRFGIQDIKEFTDFEIEDTNDFLLMTHKHAIKYYLINNIHLIDQEDIKNFIGDNDIKNENLIRIIKEKGEEIINSETIKIKNISNKIFELEKFKVDNYLTFSGFKSSTKIKTEIIELFKGDNIKKLGDYPKLLKKILDSPLLTKNIVEEEPSFYNIFIPESRKAEFSISYINACLQKNNNIELISKVRFKNIKEAITIFIQLNERNIDISKLLDTSEMRSSIISLMPKNEEDMNNMMEGLDRKDKESIKKIQSKIGEYYKKYQKYINIYYNYKEKNKEQNIPISNKKEYQNATNIKIEKNFNIEGLSEIQKELSISLLKQTNYEIIFGKDDGDIKGIIYELVNKGIDEKKLEEILNLRLKLIKEENKKIKESVGNEEVPKIDRKQLKLLDLLNNKNALDTTKLDNKINIFLKENKVIKNKEGIEVSINSTEGKRILLGLFIKKFGLKNLSQKTQSNIKRQFQNNIEEYKATQEVKHIKEFYQAVKTGDFTQYNKITEKGFYNEVDNQIIEYNKTQGITNINNRVIIDKSYNIKNIKNIDTENPVLDLGKNNKIELTQNEFKQLDIKDGNIGNPEALKNIVDMKEKLDKLGLEFVWKNRKSIFKVMNNDSEFKSSMVNINDNNLVDKREFNVLLQFILKIYGDKNPSSVESQNYARILQINEIGAISDKKEAHSGLSNIGIQFKKIGYFNSTGGIDVFGEDKLRQYVKRGYKMKKTNK